MSREAMLRPEFQEWYPGIEGGRWYPADALTDLVLQHRRSGTPQWEPEARIPCDTHFTFRGGDSGRTAPARERRGDRGGA
jgi:hypothetical protein